MRKFEKLQKKSFGFGKNTDTETGPWLWFPIQKPGFRRTLVKGGKKLTGLTYFIKLNDRQFLHTVN